MKQLDQKDLREVHSLITSAHGATTRASAAQETVKSNLERAGELIADALKQNDAPHGDGMDEAIALKEQEDVAALLALLRERYPDAGSDGDTWAGLALDVIKFQSARLKAAREILLPLSWNERVDAWLKASDL